MEDLAKNFKQYFYYIQKCTPCKNLPTIQRLQFLIKFLIKMNNQYANVY